jgi:hypothetical protein
LQERRHTPASAVLALVLSLISVGEARANETVVTCINGANNVFGYGAVYGINPSAQCPGNEYATNGLKSAPPATPSRLASAPTGKPMLRLG